MGLRIQIEHRMMDWDAGKETVVHELQQGLCFSPEPCSGVPQGLHRSPWCSRLEVRAGPGVPGRLRQPGILPGDRVLVPVRAWGFPYITSCNAPTSL